ncbi:MULTISPECIES: hypothetical protein [unclassified Brevundimonas]|uniref:hypothetical protein n=1 Tax=unclassified Brevundimonas TaxID=2622653 RepID=UPI0025BFEB6D|nr:MULTISPECIES: hypothetical protein [unclassified Brevundimonas]
MKKILMAALALSTLAAPVMAQTWQGKTYADGVATYDVNAKAASFCKFGTNNNDAGQVNAAGSNRSISLAEGDRTFNMDVQNPSDNTVRAATISFVFNHAVCNAPFTVKATSTNGGMKYSGSFTGSTNDFLTVIPYAYSLNFGGGGDGHLLATTGQRTLLDSSTARAGSATLRFSVDPQDKLLLQGDYTDNVVVTMTPKA